MTMFYDDGTPVDPLDELAFAADDADDKYQAFRRALVEAGKLQPWHFMAPPKPGMVEVAADWVAPDALDEFCRLKQAQEETWLALVMAQAEAVAE